MLRRISITNYLLIDQLELDLAGGLSIITGETGSGKSLVIGALGLAMGERAEANAARDAGRRCVIELEVDTNGLALGEWFQETGVQQEPITLLRRQLEPGGRSRAFVNDTPVRLEQLRELGERLVHVHSQHHTLLLNDVRFQLGLVDHIAGSKAMVHQYNAAYQAWRSCQRELDASRAEAARSEREMDYINFQLKELEEARLKEDEQPVIEQELARADHADELIQALQVIEDASTAENGPAAMLARLCQSVAKAARLDDAVAALAERSAALHIELKDIGEEAARTLAQMTVDPARAALLRERLDLMLRLQQKHRVTSNASLLGIAENLRGRVDVMASLNGRVTSLAAEEAELERSVQRQAAELSRHRSQAIGPLNGRVEAVLHDLGMTDAVFRFEHRTGDPGPLGIDELRATFSANRDRSPAPLDRIASGGELSRVMLAMISLAASSNDLPTVVFDEIDSGVSGEVADRVGGLLQRMGRERQVLAITHLPQIASKADTHLVVSKASDGDRVSTSIRPVKAAERVEALAQMLSGRKLTAAALANARSLLGSRE